MTAMKFAGMHTPTLNSSLSRPRSFETKNGLNYSSETKNKNCTMAKYAEKFYGQNLTINTSCSQVK